MSPATDSFKPKYRQFPPGSVVRILSPLKFDLVYTYAEENQRYEVVIRSGVPSELPGGNCATQGVKRIVDELIQQSKDDQMLMWDEKVREKYEDQFIIHFKDAPGRIEQSVQAGPIDLSIKSEDKSTVETPPEPTEEVAFPGKPAPAKVS